MRREWITVEDLSGAGVTNAMLQGDAGAGTFGGRSGLWWRGKIRLEVLVRGNKGNARARNRVRALRVPKLAPLRCFFHCPPAAAPLRDCLGTTNYSSTQPSND